MFTDKTVLIVEGEALVALDMQRDLVGESPLNIILARSGGEILASLDTLPAIDLAIIEIAPEETESAELARRLHSAGIACVLTSADHEALHNLPEFAHLPFLAKPFSRDQLMVAAHRAMALSDTAQVE